MGEVLSKVKAVLVEEVEKAGARVERILLFGSQARGEAHPDSEWDFLVVVDRERERSLPMRLAINISTRLVFEEGMVCDMLLLSADRCRERHQDVGHIAYYAAKEGVAL